VKRPRIALTVGDPAGIGPEIVDKALHDVRVQRACEPVVYGQKNLTGIKPGIVSAEAGLAAYQAIVSAVEDTVAGRVAAVVTAPINKLAFSHAGLPWKGHTDLLSHLTSSKQVAMMFWSDRLKVVLATAHLPLAKVSEALTRELLDGIIAIASQELPILGILNPRLAMAGLNPHAGEDGVLGDEETRIVVPAIKAARATGIEISGPFPADTVYLSALRGDFDAVVACYHDQGIIPVKLIAFGKAVNVTLGLPIIRTSVDHGTAFDIAGRGVADASSMVEAILLAARFVLMKSTRANQQ
jgi:4-hydroxythreonine-4-phosphate dehydrogenase